VLICIFVLAVITSGHDVITTPLTYSREISRLIYNHCASCHRPGGPAFSLMTYAEARPWAAAIKEEALERRMPPWGAVKGFGQFKDDQGLTQEQIELIADWVEGGAPEGDPKLLPKTPDFSPAHSRPVKPSLTVDSALTLKAGMALSGIEPLKVTGAGSIVITATRPDGGVEPLLWLYNYNPKFPHTYWYKMPLQLPAGTRVEVSPPSAATVGLIVGQTQKLSRAPN
jgi:hypothetical protein